jgi:hypothetical protein
MSLLVAEPEPLDSAAADLSDLGGTLDDANASAAARTTGIVAAARDEVSEAIAALFSGHGRAFRALSEQAAAFHRQFTQALGRSAATYSDAEAANASVLKPLAATPAQNIAYIIGGSGEPIPTQQFIDDNYNLFIKPFFAGYTPKPLFTPEGNYGLYTGVKSLTLDMSEAQGVKILDQTIRQQVAAGNNLVIKGESQSSTISSMVMPLLHSQGVPTDAVHFVLTGDPNAPNGGLFERLNGLSIPSLGITFNGATPDNLYPTTIWTQEYDGFADVPQYPINLLSDLNSLLGIYYVHPTYTSLTPGQIQNAIPLPTEGPTMTQYYMIPTADLPLLDPLRAIPIIGNPLADLMQPDLRVLVNLGYGDPTYGWSQGPANVPTEFGLFPSLSDVAKVPGLIASGTPQGIHDFVTDISAEFSDPGSLLPHFGSGGTGAPGFALPSLADLRSALSPASLDLNFYNTVSTVSRVSADTYATLLPTADVINGLVTSLPAYDVNLFLQGLQDGNLAEALLQPIATDTYLIPLAGAFELFAVINQVETIVADLGIAV